MPKPSRHNARILAFRILYSRSKVGISADGEDKVFEEAGLTSKYQEFSKNLIEGTWQELDKIDSIIQKKLKNWKQTRIADTLNALLRVSIGELLIFPETESKIIINEALEICKEYVDAKATRICNGVLHSAAEEIRVEQDHQKEG